MMRAYCCEKCGSLLFTGSVESLMTRRRPDAPEYIEMTCAHCGHTNRLTHAPNEELKKSQGEQDPA